MNLTWDKTKRQITLRDRGIDFADSAHVFAGPVFEFEDVRRDYGERRMICYGLLAGRLVVVGYVPRGDDRHIFSMRKANERETARYGERLEQA
ncbi:MAG: BrnT family toxin [Gammaproteobacteria bacterium]|nr:BrnT family toxin [Gammaproteobacteria bacterium]MBU1653541.1 BrnT family toxin [Gammaproteobacteria bacterium]MBU1961883.1 BrnT family toxin [Gammaproteobacteria bacterium]